MNGITKTTTSHALRLLDEMDGYFTSMNSVQPLPAERKSVPVGEWTELRDAVRAALASAAPQAPIAWLVQREYDYLVTKNEPSQGSMESLGGISYRPLYDHAAAPSQAAVPAAQPAVASLAKRTLDAAMRGDWRDCITTLDLLHEYLSLPQETPSPSQHLAAQGGAAPGMEDVPRRGDQSPEAALVAAARAVLERWNSPQWDWTWQGPTADLMANLRDALVAAGRSGGEG